MKSCYFPGFNIFFLLVHCQMTQCSWILRSKGRNMSWMISDEPTTVQRIKLESGHGTMDRWVVCVIFQCLVNRLSSKKKKTDWLSPPSLCFLCFGFSLMMGFLLLVSLSWKRVELPRLVGENRLMWCESSQPWWDCTYYFFTWSTYLNNSLHNVLVYRDHPA